MTDRTGIERTDSTPNPVPGCAEFSPGCDHWYARIPAGHFRGTLGTGSRTASACVRRPEPLDHVLRWNRPSRRYSRQHAARRCDGRAS